VRILGGIVSPDKGKVLLAGQESQHASPAGAERAGIGIAFQESSLVADLSAAENLVLGSSREPFTMRKRSLVRLAQQICKDAQTPPIDLDRPVGELSLPQRQILEVVKAVQRATRILVLDEANSALSGDYNRWFLDTARRAAARGVLVLFISHRMAEVREIADEITVLRGGAVVLSCTPANTSDQTLVEAMVGRRVGMEKHHVAPIPGDGPPALEARSLRPQGSHAGGLHFSLRAGEVVGLAGLDGNGQLEVISALAGDQSFKGELLLEGKPYRPRDPSDALKAGVALVPADRQNEGLLPSWSIERNISLSSLDQFVRAGLVNERMERQSTLEVAKKLGLPWERIDIATATLSGGNQQRVVLARVLLTRPKVLLLFDGTRGVDVATRSSLLALIAEVAATGTAVLFYSSDLSEYTYIASRVLVMSRGAIVGEVAGADITEDAILHVAVSGQPSAASPAATERFGVKK
jgi:ABC-type sugar transport system ATPase subunit